MIRRIELHNFASHDETEIEFDTGKNVIIGSTGSGKTNILQAIDFAFLGDVPEVHLPELISDGSDTAEVIIEYDDPRTSQAYRIQRILKRTSDVKADHECTVTNLATNEVVKKPEPVKRTLESFGVDASVWRYVVHVAQGKFSDLLEETQERKNSLDKLFQVNQLENTYQELGRRESPIGQIERRKQTKKERKIRLEEAIKPLEQEEKNLEQLQVQQEQKRAELKSVEKEYERLTSSSKKSAEALKQFLAIEEQITKYKMTSENARNQINDALHHLEGILSHSDYENLRIASSIQITNYLQELEQEFHKTEEEQIKLNTENTIKIERAAQLKSKLDQTLNQELKMQQETTEIEKHIQGKISQPRITCEKCGSILTKTEWEKHLTERRHEIKDAQNHIDQIKIEFASAQEDVEKSNKLLDATRNNLTKLAHTIPFIKQAEQQRHIVEQGANQKFSESRDDLITKLRKLLCLNASMPAEEVIDHALSLPNDLKRTHSRIGELTSDLKTFEERVLKLQSKRVEEAKLARTELLRLIPDITTEEDKIARLENIRTSFREIQPIVRRSFVTRITQSANDYMKRLYGDAELESFEITEDYEFLITRAKHKRHSRRLSGGQQVLVSMALLLALSETLSQLDFLILDEPTTHLDAIRRKELVSVLANLRRVPQLIIVDHHPELLEAADIAFSVNLTTDGQSRVARN